MTSAAGPERRGEVRVPYTSVVSINGTIMVKAVDISRRGIYLQTGRSFPPGTLVDLSFPIHGRVIAAKARVRYDQKGIGMGLYFLHMAKEDHVLLEEYVVLPRGGPAAGKGREKVLIVASDSHAALTYHSGLLHEGWSVVMAGRISEALRLVEGEEGIGVAAIIEDVENPLLLEEVRGLLARLKSRGIPAVVISPNSQLGTAGTVLGAGAADFLPRSTTTPKKLHQVIGALKSR